MRLIINEKKGCCESIHIEYTPVEALIINQAMRRYVCDEEVNATDRELMKQMLEVKPMFVDVAENEGHWIVRSFPGEHPFFAERDYCSVCGDWQTHGALKYCPNCGARMSGEVEKE